MLIYVLHKDTYMKLFNELVILFSSTILASWTFIVQMRHQKKHCIVFIYIYLWIILYSHAKVAMVSSTVYLEFWGQSWQVRGGRALNVALVSIDQEIIHVNKQQQFKEGIDERCIYTLATWINVDILKLKASITEEYNFTPTARWCFISYISV